MAQTLADLGEFGLIARLRRRIPADETVPIGPGDDAAMLATESLTLAAADLTVEGVHFDLALTSAQDAGYKSVAVNVSDIAAMGGSATFALLGFAAPPTTPVAVAEAILDGIFDAARQFGVRIAGGDVSAAPQIVLSVAILGTPGPAGPLRRSGASAGDLLCVTGALGAAAAGLALLRLADHDQAAAELLKRFPSLAERHARPQIRDRAGPSAATAGATAMLDISDGVAKDGGHLAEESGLGLLVEGSALPLAPGVAEVAAFLGIDSVTLAAGGGEDYELAMAAPLAAIDAIRAAVAPLPLTVIGEFLPATGHRVLRHAGQETDLTAVGWEHFG